MTSPAHLYIEGALCGLAAASIWSGWVLASRLGVTTNLSPWDITAIRFAVAGLILLPYLMKKGLALDRLGWTGVAALVVGGGAPMVLLANAGLVFAPAAHASALYTGTIPLQVAILAWPLLGERFTRATWIGLALILSGVAGILWGAGATVGARQTIGHALFLVACTTWALYTVVMRRARLDGLHAAAIAAVGTLVTYVPAYAVAIGATLLQASSPDTALVVPEPSRLGAGGPLSGAGMPLPGTGTASLGVGATLLAAPWPDIALQALVQGLLTAVVSFLLYGRAVSLLGASSGAAFAALAPAITAVAGGPLLGEWPSASDWAAIAAISAGVYFVSGGPGVGGDSRH